MVRPFTAVKNLHDYGSTALKEYNYATLLYTAGPQSHIP